LQAHASHNAAEFNPFRGKLTYMSPRVKRYTDIYVILTYTGTETHVSFWLFIPEIHFLLFRARVKISFTSKRVKDGWNTKKTLIYSAGLD